MRLLIFKISLLCALTSTSFVFAKTSKQPAGTELARVAILEFQDNTGQSSYGWVKTSLPDAINSSLKDQFEYERADISAGKPGKVPQSLNAETVGVIAKQQSIDIVVFGSYDYDPKTKLAVFTANVYHQKGQRIIGTVVEQSKLNNDVFNTIDKISKKIVGHIYRFSLDLTEQQAQEKGEQSVRLLVLVPTWTNEAQKKAATAELDLQKKELHKKYKVDVLTIFEFFKVNKTPAGDQKQVETFAKARNDAKISDWLKTQKVANAMIVFVADNRVSLRPVIEGNSKPPVTYATNAPSAQKLSIIDAAVTQSGMKENLQKTTLKRDPGVRDRFSLAGGLIFVAPVGASSDKINSGPGLEAQALYRVVNLWEFQLGAAASAQAALQKAYLSTGDEDFTLQHYTGLVGPALIVPLPFYRSLEFQFLLLGGATYSRLVKYKYVDTPLTFNGVSPAASAQFETRWHILLGVFVGAGVSYHRIFFSGTDMSYMSTSLRAGYRF